MPTKTFKPGEVIFRQGDAGNREAYVVHEGKVEVRKQSGGGTQVLRTLVNVDPPRSAKFNGPFLLSVHRR